MRLSTADSKNESADPEQEIRRFWTISVDSENQSVILSTEWKKKFADWEKICRWVQICTLHRTYIQCIFLVIYSQRSVILFNILFYTSVVKVAL